MSLVPITILIDDGSNIFSLQYFWETENSWGPMPAPKRRIKYEIVLNGYLRAVLSAQDNDVYIKTGFANMFAFDFLTDNTDRNVNNYLISYGIENEGQGFVIGIDHEALWGIGFGLDSIYIDDMEKRKSSEVVHSFTFYTALKEDDNNKFRQESLESKLFFESQIDEFLYRKNQFV